MTPFHDPTWTHLQAELRRTVSESTYDIWLAPLSWGGIEGDSVVVLAPEEIRVWVQQRFGATLEAAARAVLGHQTGRVQLRAHEEGDRAPGRATPAPAPPPALREDEPKLNPKFTFEQFVIGDANRFAHAAALAVAELPGQAYNPLFLYGPPGVGKTHLLHSIGNYVRAYGAGMTVRYSTIERFTNEFVAALQSGDIDRFKGRYRRNDVLLIDDVQFLQSKVRTEEEFFHTFNALHDTGSQLVLTCDRMPADMDGLELRLRERFEAGLLVDIAPPDPATRLTVLRKRVHHDGIVLAEEAVLELLAERVTTNLRALEGALIRVVAYASLTDRELTVDLADQVLGRLYDDNAPGRTVIGGPRLRKAGPTVDSIQQVVADHFGITREELVSPSRAAKVTWPRQLAMYLVREHTTETLPAIGARFGGRDHSTVINACKRAALRIGSDPEAFDAVRSLTEQLTAGGAVHTE